VNTCDRFLDSDGRMLVSELRFLCQLDMHFYLLGISTG